MRRGIAITLVAVTGLVAGQSPSNEAAVYRAALTVSVPSLPDAVAVRLSDSTTQAFSKIWRQFEAEAYLCGTWPCGLSRSGF